MKDADLISTVKVKRPPPKGSLDLKLFVRLFGYTKECKAIRNWLFLIVLIRSIQLPVAGWAVGAIIQGPIVGGDWTATQFWAVGFLVFVLLTNGLHILRSRLALILGERVVSSMRRDVFDHFLKMPVSYFNERALGRLVSRVTSDINSIRAGVQNVVFVGLVQFGQMMISGVIMAILNWRLFLLILALVPILLYINQVFKGKISESARAAQESFSIVTANLAESVKGMRVTQGFTREEINAGIFRRLVYSHSQYNMDLARRSNLFLSLLELNSQFFIASLLIVGGYGTLIGGWPMAPEDLIVFFFLANLFFSPIRVLGNQYQTLLASLAGAERIFRVLDTKPAWQDPEDAIKPDKLSGEVEFKGITFGYNPEVPVLKNIFFKAKPGQSIALVGHTGSGKSSIINLLSKFYLSQQGEILLDGINLHKISGAALRKRLGIVLQMNFLFRGSVIDNIRFGRLEASDEEVKEAVRQLDCLDLIEAMPDGFDTLVEENGAGLSLGQRQLVCFARAFLANPDILIMDEATSSLDTITESRLQKALIKLLDGRTSFIVAHRLSTIRRADQVLVLDHGEIIESGNHEELLTKDGVYANLYRRFLPPEQKAH